MEKDQQIACEYFKALRAEIDTRTKNHSYLTISKIVACAALLGHLVTNKASVPGLISVPVLAFALDLMIYHNLTGINSIGKYIRDVLEKQVFKKMLAQDWELYEQRAQTSRTGRMDFILDRFGQLVITGIFAVLSLVLATPRPVEEANLLHWWLFVGSLMLLDGIAAWCSRAGDGPSA